jgi:hypothetical protein
LLIIKRAAFVTIFINEMPVCHYVLQVNKEHSPVAENRSPTTNPRLPLNRRERKKRVPASVAYTRY